MNNVEPIKDKRKIEAMKRYLKGKSTRDYLLFVAGISSALRVSDLLRLRVRDVWDGRNVVKSITIKEKKTGKGKQFAISKNFEKAIREFAEEHRLQEPNQFLFLSRQGDNQPISRSQAFRIIKDAAKAVGVKENIGTHSLRKTWGYWAYHEGYSITLISTVLNHTSEAVTRRYIGITQDDIDQAYIKLNL
jgi:integrase